MKRKVNGRIIYYYSFYDDNDKRRYRSTGCRTKAAALDYVMKKRDEGLLKAVDRTRTPFGEYAGDFFVWGKCPIIGDKLERGRRASKSTAYNNRSLFRLHILPYFSDISMNSITPSKVNAWLLALPKEHGISASTANLSYNILSVVMDYAVRDGVIASNPCRKVQKLGSDSERCDAFTREEVRAIIGKPEDWPNFLHRTMCYIAALTGMRVAEILALMPEDIGEDRIRVAWSYNTHDGRKSTKTGENRTVPITKSLHDLILSFTNGEGRYIFSLDGGEKPMSYTCIYKALNRRMEALGIKDRTFHSFRAFVDTELDLANLNESVIRKIIGHKDKKMTEHYLHLESGDLRLVKDVQDGIENGLA